MLNISAAANGIISTHRPDQRGGEDKHVIRRRLKTRKTKGKEGCERPTHCSCTCATGSYGIGEAVG